MFPDGSFPGYPGPVDPRRGLANVPFPALPQLPGRHPYPAHPGFAGGLQAFGVPIGQSPAGRPMVQAGMANGFQLPPDLPGMPTMPGPPAGMFQGGLGGGGLFQPAASVAPFDPGNQVRQLKAQQYRA